MNLIKVCLHNNISSRMYHNIWNCLSAKTLNKLQCILWYIRLYCNTKVLTLPAIQMDICIKIYVDGGTIYFALNSSNTKYILDSNVFRHLMCIQPLWIICLNCLKIIEYVHSTHRDSCAVDTFFVNIIYNGIPNKIKYTILIFVNIKIN